VVIESVSPRHSAYKGLFMVEGVENPTGTWQTSNGRWWGGDLGKKTALLSTNGF
jgi:hypothetical protein